MTITLLDDYETGLSIILSTYIIKNHLSNIKEIIM